ncbi:MAG: elongation factor P maturation arginine rhamnosyltransferase EarP [Casimicrobiaceae bacterium]|nr:elongation factor P maturation arginine rhamnosyltransferase EarP [Casimicrobiaceae bacterium]
MSLSNLPFSHCDLFCRVIDHWGDAGVCWRLTAQLVQDYGVAVRLFIDEIAPLRVIAGDRLEFDGDRAVGRGNLPVRVLPWDEAHGLPASNQAPLVIEAFACHLPASYVETMATQAAHGCKALWINLEYLSAEPWVDEVHGLPSPHPRLPLIKYFFVPGFSARSGGLLRERNFVAPPPRAVSRPIQLFAFTYATAPVARLAEALAAQTSLAAPVEEPPARSRSFEPVPQSAFDAVLAAHDVLLVRGEDSFVRAQYAGRPLLWDIYPTTDGAHRAKLKAWLDRYCQGLDAETDAIYRRVSVAFVERSLTLEDARAFASALPTLAAHARTWQQYLLGQTDLLGRLLSFARTQQRIGSD